MAQPVCIAIYGNPPEFLRAMATQHWQVVSAEQAEAAPEMIQGILSYHQSRPPLNAALLSHFPHLKIISHHGVGYDGIDTAWCHAHGVVVTHTPDILNDEVADLAMGLMLATVRQIPQADAYVRSGHWAQAPYPLTASLKGRCLGILGLGRIGRAIAQRAEAFGLQIAYHNRHPNQQVAYTYCETAEALAETCDILLVAAPATPETRHMVDTNMLKLLGPNGILINISRGSLVDEAALINALRDGTILAAGLDVYENEPLPNPEFFALRNTVLLPHVASASLPTRQAMAQLVIDNLQHYFTGAGPLTPVPETPWNA